MKNWTQLLPLAGVALGSGMTLVGQALTDARAIRRDRIVAEREAEQRRQTDWLILERQTIIELQESLELMNLLAGEPAQRRVRDSLADSAADIVVKIQSRAARLTDRQLAEDILTWLGASLAPEDRTRQMRTLLERLGANLRDLHAGP